MTTSDTTELDVELPAVCCDALMGIRQADYRFLVLYGGRGSAKSHSVARALLLLGGEEPLRILCGREVQNSIKDSVHRLLSDTIQGLGMEGYYRVLDTEIRGENGTLFIFSGLSTQTIDSIKSLEGIDLVWLEEAQVLTKRSLDILIPTIRKTGSKFIMTMNPNLETDAVSKRFLLHSSPRVKAIRMNYWSNPWFPAELEAERREHKERDPDTYAHVWEGEHLPAVEGAIWFKEIQAAIAERRIRPVPVDPLLKVHTVWDLGFSDHTAIILVQKSGNALMIVGALSDNNRAISSYVAQLQAMPIKNWGDDYIPHDGFNKHPTDGKSVADILSALGRNVEPVPAATVESGIKLAREVFPRVYIDEDAGIDPEREDIPGLVDALKRYQWDVPKAGDRDARRPLHNEYSHYGDAFRYLALCAPLFSNEDYFDQPLDYSQIDRGIT